MSVPSDWRRVWRGNPCPICEKSDWCLLSRDGSAAICARMESPKRRGEAGWLHRLTESTWTPARHVHRVTMPGSGPDLGHLAEQYRQALDAGRLQQLAATLGLSADSLLSFRVGWTGKAFSFPMQGAAGQVIGIRLRGLDGCKWSVKGGHEGMFLPSNLSESTDKRLLICEGPTDAAALFDLSYTSVAGRPSCTGGIKLLTELVRQRHPAEIVIIADGDEVGLRGAENLASVLLIYCGAVRVVAPRKFKDIREFVHAGGKREQLDSAIGAAPVRKLTAKRAM